MKHTIKTLLICAGMSFSLGALADIDDVTVDVMDHSAELPDAVKGEIELPEHARDEAHEASEHGRDTANENRHRGKDEHGPDHDNDDAKDEAEDHKHDADEHKEDADDHKEDADDHKEEHEDDGEEHKEGAMEHQEEAEDHKDDKAPAPQQ